ncbi:uncharacterized protein LOC110978339 [Acanthaster planci]|uniref:Uncharacterized protein LOC110978339 n=1 Tax=Acanthaster planci TaxID=133434 RepID=A0A8B7Y6W8_ACAPL|nr:uncharacterized protein LOC110978339 [Acanthaster planci]
MASVDAESAKAPEMMGADNNAVSTELTADPAAAELRESDILPGKESIQLVPQSTAIQKTPALCTATAKWKSKISSAKASEVLPSGENKPADMEDGDAKTHPLSPNAPDIKGDTSKDEGSPLVGPSSPGHQPNGSAAHHGEANKMIRPSISITEAPQVGRPPSRISGRASASSLSMLATESGKLLQAVPLATGGPSGQQQDIQLATLRINNHSLLAAIPYMHVGLAYMCLILNIFVPGSGTLISGFSLFCCKAQPQQHTKKDELINSFCTNVCVAVSQLFTVPFLLVGWIWSVTWGVFMVQFAIEYRNYKRNEKKISTAKAVTKAFMGR